MIQVTLVVGTPGAEAGARRGDLVVVVGALRASVTVTAALAWGASKVFPDVTLSKARDYLGRSDLRVAGERI